MLQPDPDSLNRRCGRKVCRNKYERNAPEIRNWWYELFGILEADASIDPDKRKEILSMVFPRYLLNRILSILSTRDVKFRRELYDERGKPEDAGAMLFQDGTERKKEMSFDSISPLTQKSTIDLEELEEMKVDIDAAPAPNVLHQIFTPEAGITSKAKIYMDFFKRKPTRAAVWRTLPPLSTEEMNLNQKAEAVTKKIASEFVDWLRSLGGDEDTTLSVQTVVEMFEIGFQADTAKALKIGMKEMPSIPQKVAEARGLPHMAKRAMLQREIQKDARATRRKPHLVAFSGSLPVELQIKPPDESNVKKWLVCEKVPYNLQSMATVWQGITHLKSTRAFCEFLLEKPEVRPPGYLVEIGMLDKKTLLEREKLSDDYLVSVSQIAIPAEITTEATEETVTSNN